MVKYYYIQTEQEGIYTKKYTDAISIQNLLYDLNQRIYPIRIRNPTQIPNNHLEYINELNNNSTQAITFPL